MFSENNLISKSRPLLEMKNSGYNMGEFKILDTYLSRINPLKPETARVTFKKEEYCSLLGVDSGKIRPKQLSKYTSHFLGNIVTLPRPDKKKGYIQKPLFTLAEYDEEAKEIVLECNSDPQIFDMFFNVDNIGYVKYILRNTIHFKSMYSFKLFMLIKSKQPASEFTMSLTELREKLEITAPRYNEFKFLNAEVLKKVHQEINDNDNTDMRFEYEQVKRGRNTVAIKFKNIKIKTPVYLNSSSGSEAPDLTSENIDFNTSELYQFDFSTNPMELKFKTSDDFEIYAGEYIKRNFNDKRNELIVDWIPADVHQFDEGVVDGIRNIVTDKVPFHIIAPQRTTWACDTLDRFNKQEWNLKKSSTKTTAKAHYIDLLKRWLAKNFETVV